MVSLKKWKDTLKIIHRNNIKYLVVYYPETVVYFKILDTLKEDDYPLYLRALKIIGEKTHYSKNYKSHFNFSRGRSIDIIAVDNRENLNELMMIDEL